MNKFAFVVAVASVSFYTVGAQAGGFGGSKSTKIIGGNSGISSGLINISPSIGLGNVTALNNILSGNVVSGILNGNSVGNGILSGIGITGLGNTQLGNNTSYKLNRKHHR